jgi:hypothetical protein
MGAPLRHRSPTILRKRTRPGCQLFLKPMSRPSSSADGDHRGNQDRASGAYVKGQRSSPANQPCLECRDATVSGGNGSRLCENSAWYNCTQNFEACGHAQSKETQEFVLRSPLRPNQISFSHGLGHGLPSQRRGHATGVSQIADDLLRRPSRQSRANCGRTRQCEGPFCERCSCFHAAQRPCYQGRSE